LSAYSEVLVGKMMAKKMLLASESQQFNCRLRSQWHLFEHPSPLMLLSFAVTTHWYVLKQSVHLQWGDHYKVDYLSAASVVSDGLDA